MENPTVRPTTTGGKSVYSIQRAKTILIGSTTLRTKFIIRVTNPMLFPLSCILSRQPARTTLRCASSPPLRFGPAGVRSGTQPTVVVAKGKISNCRVCTRPSEIKSVRNPFAPKESRHFFYLSVAGPKTPFDRQLLNRLVVRELPRNQSKTLAYLLLLQPGGYESRIVVS